jgi:hypothetical protein
LRRNPCLRCGLVDDAFSINAERSGCRDYTVCIDSITSRKEKQG